MQFLCKYFQLKRFSHFNCFFFFFRWPTNLATSHCFDDFSIKREIQIMKYIIVTFASTRILSSSIYFFSSSLRNNTKRDSGPLKDMLLHTPPPMEEEGVWKLERKFVRNSETNTVSVSMIWVVRSLWNFLCLFLWPQFLCPVHNYLVELVTDLAEKWSKLLSLHKNGAFFNS